MRINKLNITITRYGREERVEVTDIDHTSPDVEALIRVASKTMVTMTLSVDAGDNDVAAALGRLRWGNPVGKYEKPVEEVEAVATTEEAYLEKLNTRLEDYSWTEVDDRVVRLPTYVVMTLKRADIQYIWQVVEKTETDLLKIKGFGRTCLNWIKELLDCERSSLGTKFDDEIRAQLIQPE